MEINKIENEYNLKLTKSQRGKDIIIQNKTHIFYNEYTRSDKSRIFKCSYYRDKKFPYKAYVIIKSDNQYDQLDY